MPEVNYVPQFTGQDKLYYTQAMPPPEQYLEHDDLQNMRRLEGEVTDLKEQNHRLYQIISRGFVDKKKYDKIKQENGKLNM